jgi:hypothetical protein
MRRQEMKHIVEFDEKCKSCKGTGLYVGIGERDGAAVVCRACDGTGKYHFKHEYEDFIGREKREKVKRVYQANPGIGIGEAIGKCTLEDFGGMPYEDWLKGKPFPPKSEMRKYTCPAWWYQSADYDKKPDWPECILGGTFSECSRFYNKHKCWEKWDEIYK